MSPKYDLTVIGAGPGGYTAAISAAQHGMKVALIEARDLGGACLNRGCIPTKTLLHSAELFRAVKAGSGIGIKAEKLSYDMGAICARRDEVVSGIRDGIGALISANSIDVFHGRANVIAARQVLAAVTENETLLDTDRILVAVGSLPVRPPIEGIGLPGVVSSDELLEGESADYGSLIIIGGGVIGVEFASVYSSLGCEVTIIEAMDRIVPTLDREISQNLALILKKRGVRICTGCTVERLSEGAGGLCCRFTGRNGVQELTAQGVLVSVGRRPNLEGLFGEGIAVARQRGILVDERFESSVKGIFAIGDAVEGSIQLAHAAAAQALNAVAAMAGEMPPINLSAVPSCVYTSPEIATVGLTADQAKAAGIEVKTGKYAMSGNAKTLIERQERSFVKLVFDAQTEVLLGAQLMCARASDMVSELSSAIVNKLTIHQLSAIIRPHPTFAEAVTEAAEDAEGRAIHLMPKAKR